MNKIQNLKGEKIMGKKNDETAMVQGFIPEQAANLIGETLEGTDVEGLDFDSPVLESRTWKVSELLQLEGRFPAALDSYESEALIDRYRDELRETLKGRYIDPAYVESVCTLAILAVSRIAALHTSSMSREIRSAKQPNVPKGSKVAMVLINTIGNPFGQLKRAKATAGIRESDTVRAKAWDLIGALAGLASFVRENPALFTR